jgi:hypothetical protein
MPIHVRDPWRFQYFEKVPCPDHVNVPIDDIDCWEWFAEHRKIYDKLNVAKTQNFACGTQLDHPKHFPVFAKPRVNLKGMGLNSCVVLNSSEFETVMQPDLIWTAFFEGPHISTDCAVVKGEVKWIRHATGEIWTDGMFKHWVIESAQNIELERYISTWVSQNLHGYTGMLNLETIGGKIIEAHLRFADQWCDLYGEGWVGAVVELYQSGNWQFKDDVRQDGYSVPLFARHGLMPSPPPLDLQNDIRSRAGISSLQITFHPQKAGEEHPMPPGGFRLCIVNCTDLEAGFQARRDLAKAFEGVEVILP